ncbi:hypothetical protein UPYG_G00323330 [Umbra pygmaea]|uniref:Uncharacterized protein n=1 Tax=Umbra pygmaea TaxID=75934 RepID=A0ABD0WIB4_UMBPY
MNGESLQRPDPVRLVLADSDTQRIVIPGSPDLSVPDKIDPKEDNDIVAVTINLNHLSHCERMNLFKVIEPYDDNMTVVKKQDLKDNVSLNSLERGLRGPGDMLKNTHSRMQQSVEAPMIKVDGLRGQLNTERGLKSEMNGHTLNEKLYNGNMDTPGTSGGAKFTMPTFGMSGPVIKGADLDGSLSSPQVNLSTPNLSTQYASLDLTDPEVNTDFKGPGLRGELETPNLNLSASDMDMNVNDIKMNVPNADLKKPKFGLPGGKMKGSNLNLSSPDINLTTPNIDGAINAPNVDMSLPNLEGALQSPELNVEAPSGNRRCSRSEYQCA